jgi:hypothetical protein
MDTLCLFIAIHVLSTLLCLKVVDEVPRDWLELRDVSDILQEAKQRYFCEKSDDDELDNIYVYDTVKS